MALSLTPEQLRTLDEAERRLADITCRLEALDEIEGDVTPEEEAEYVEIRGELAEIRARIAPLREARTRAAA